MWKKISIQIILFSTVILLIFFAYVNYFKSDKKTLVKELKNVEGNKLSLNGKDTNENNLVKNLKYSSKDNLGNEYLIESESSELDLKNPDIIYMKNVKAQITMVNSDPIEIFSDSAIYNNKNYETNFLGNVSIYYLDNKIKCQKLDISIENNYAMVSDDVIYENLKAKLIADRIEIDLITKNSKIFMIDKNKKIKILNK